MAEGTDRQRGGGNSVEVECCVGWARGGVGCDETDTEGGRAVRPPRRQSLR